MNKVKGSNYEMHPEIKLCGNGSTPIGGVINRYDCLLFVSVTSHETEIFNCCARSVSFQVIVMHMR